MKLSIAVEKPREVPLGDDRILVLDAD